MPTTDGLATLYRALFEHSLDGVLITKPDGAILRANSAACRAFGRSEAEMIRLGRAHHVVDDPASRAFLAERERTGSSRAELTYRRADGILFPVQVSSSVILGEGGERHTCVIFRDVTAQKAADDALRRGEQAARARAAELEAVLDAVPAAVFITRDASARTMEGNRFCAETLRMPAGRNVSKSAPDAERPAEFRAMKDGVEMTPDELPVQRAAASGRAVRDFEFDLVFDDGEVRILFGNATPLLDGGGRPAGAVGAFIDVTEKRRAEERLKESETLYRTLFTLAPSGVVVTDETGRIYAFNDQAHENLGYTREEFADLRISDLDPDEGPEDVRRRTLQIFEAGAAEFDARHCTKTGAVRHVRSRSRVAQIHGARRLVSVWQDVTERKITEEALRAKDETLRRTLSFASAGIWELDCTTSQLTWSPETFALLGVDPSTPPTREVWALCVHPDDVAAANAAMRDAIEGRTGAYRAEFRVLHPARGTRWVLGVGRVERTADARPLRLLGLDIDITDRKRAEDEVRAADQQKTEFLGVLSHELRNPLAPIRNSIYLLDRLPAGAPQAVRAKEVIRRQAEHLTRLVDDLLDVTRISHGKIVLDRVRLDLRDVVRKTTDDLGSLFEQAGIALRVAQVPRPVWIDADATRIAQVLGNLLQNAVKFTPPGGDVAVDVAASGARAEIRVRDTGTGIDAETMRRLFQPFAQADRTLARTKGGLGLGLALVKGLVELHGGSVDARSGGAGSGAEFVVAFPLAEPAAEDVPRAVAESRAGAPRTVLVIEDNLDAGQSLAEILELAGHTVRVARSGRSGLSLARELRPDVVLCDIGLPDLDGYEVARAIRRDRGLCGTRLVAVSGYAQPEDRRRARDAGFDGHVAKPAGIDELLAALGSATGRAAR